VTTRPTKGVIVKISFWLNWDTSEGLSPVGLLKLEFTLFFMLDDY